MKKISNQIYRDLIARLGELYLQKENIEKQIIDIRAKVEFLNSITSFIKDDETKEVSND